MWLHFSTPGDYEICFYLECPAIPCGAGKATIADECLPAKVYQWKDAENIPLFRKWNLISLPLVPLEKDVPIEDVLASLPDADTLFWGVYLYDPALLPGDPWLVYGPGQDSLDTLIDGVSYWVKIEYSHTDLTKQPGDPVGCWWVWGTPKPVPPDSPSAYPEYTGWNMVGITGYDDGTGPPLGAGLGPTTDQLYLWNWWVGGAAQYGAIYAWDPDGTATTIKQSWYSMLPTTGPHNLPDTRTGQGYWISFQHDGMVYPP
jgi:hypothetical protein